MFLDRRLIIFDLDGTLIDSLGVWSQVDQALVEKLSADHVRISEDEAYERRAAAMKTYGEGSEAYVKYCGDLKKAFRMTGTPEEIHAQRYDLAQEFLRTRVGYRPGVPAVLKALKGAGLKLAIATTTRRRNLDTYAEKNLGMRREAPMADFFELTMTRDDVERVKPDPEVFLRIMAHFGLPPEACLVVEDALPGVIGARAAGIDSVVITERHSESARAALDEAAIARFEDYGAFLAALEAEIGEAGAKRGA